MLDAAVTFAETLQDADRVAKVAKIRSKLEASIDEIVAHQSVLERKLAAQCVNYTHRRDKLDRLENSSIRKMFAADEKQRAEVGSALEVSLPAPCMTRGFPPIVTHSASWGRKLTLR